MTRKERTGLSSAVPRLNVTEPPAGPKFIILGHHSNEFGLLGQDASNDDHWIRSLPLLNGTLPPQMRY